MTAEAFKITIHMVASVDGMIAKKDNSISWFDTTSDYEKGVTWQSVAEYLKPAECYIMGARTYEHGLELAKSYGWPYSDVPTIVVTHRELPSYGPHIEFYSGDLTRLVNERLKPNYRNVWMLGGALLTRDFIRLRLANEIRLCMLPIILGDGTPFFDHIGQEQALHLKDVTAYKNGMVELCYEIKI
jgi:dihydrofolate reductase